MQALETVVSITDHRLVIEDSVLPDHVERARVIVLWDSPSAPGRRSPPAALAGAGAEHGDILDGPPVDDWEALA